MTARNKASVLPEGVVLEGVVEGGGDLVVRGRIEGPVHVDGALVIDESGLVRGHVRARSVTVRGVLKGNAYGDESIRIDASARVVGDVTAPRVRVVRGARFRGQVHMGEAGEPVLATYDPRQHTFTGAPAPEPEPATRELTARESPPPWETLVGEAVPKDVLIAEVSKTQPGRPVALQALDPEDDPRDYSETIPAPPRDERHDTDMPGPLPRHVDAPMNIPAAAPVPMESVHENVPRPARRGPPPLHLPTFGRIAASRRTR